MHMGKIGAILALLLFLPGCTGTEGSTPGEAKRGEISLVARFRSEDGGVLRGGAVRFSAEKDGDSYPLDSEGVVSVSGLSRDEELLLTLLDQHREVQGSMTLSFSEGTVIDAVTGEDGVGHITIRDDTDEVALAFVLSESGALQCNLWLAQDTG